MMRIFAVFGVLLIGMFFPIWVFIAGTMLYAVRFGTIEMIVIAGFIDAYYGYTLEIFPVYTIITIVIMVSIEYIRPSIALYNK